MNDRDRDFDDIERLINDSTVPGIPDIEIDYFGDKGKGKGKKPIPGGPQDDYPGDSILSEPFNPEVTFKMEHTAWAQMMCYVRAARGEISGFGKIVEMKGRDADEFIAVCTEVKIFNQVCSPAHTTLSSEALSQFVFDLIKSGQNPQEWNLWWHSHAHMSAFFSGTDVSTIKKLSSKSRLYSLCANKRGHMIARVDEVDKSEYLFPVTLPPLGTDFERACAEEVKAKVKEQGYGFHTTARFDRHGRSDIKARHGRRSGSGR